MSVASLSTRPPRIRRRWPSAAFVLGVISCALLLWRITTAKVTQPLPPAGVPIRVVRVIDGDTLLLDGDFRVRLLGVNTPETKHPDRPAEPYGEVAFRFTQTLVAQKFVTLEFDRERLDNYRRILAYVYLENGQLLNEQLIRNGMSPAVVTFPLRSDRRRLFEQAERSAQAGPVGIWTLDLWQKKRQEQLARKRAHPR